MIVVYFNKEQYPLSLKTWYSEVKRQTGSKDPIVCGMFAFLGWMNSKNQF